MVRRGAVRSSCLEASRELGTWWSEFFMNPMATRFTRLSLKARWEVTSCFRRVTLGGCSACRHDWCGISDMEK